MAKRDEAAQLREEQNLRNLEAGGVPVAAEERLQARCGKPFFVTGLSVNGLGLVRQTGYQAVGQVMGTSMYHVGWQYGTGATGYISSSMELETVGNAHREARRLALSRIEHEARLLGAHGVVGVRLECKRYGWGFNLIDFSVTGTAIRIEGESPPDRPFVSDLSGEDFFRLWRSGFKPLMFAYGNCFWYEVPGAATSNAMTGWGFGSAKNQELEDFSAAVRWARDLAMGRLAADCEEAGATGVVGVTVERKLNTVPVAGWGKSNSQRVDLVVHMQVTGTAIAPRPGAGESPVAGLAVSLLDRRCRNPIERAGETRPPKV